MNTKPNPIVVVILLLVVLGAGYWYFFMRPATLVSGGLTASGTVETTEISIAPETSGKILEVNVQEGDSVKAGDAVLVTFHPMKDGTRGGQFIQAVLNPEHANRNR